MLVQEVPLILQVQRDQPMQEPIPQQQMLQLMEIMQPLVQVQQHLQ